MPRRRKTKIQKIVAKIDPHAAAVDVGATEIYAAVSTDLTPHPVCKFETFTDSLRSLVAWFVSLGIKSVAMEATSVYWIPLAELLEEAGIGVHLINPRYARNVSGRKSDMMDCQWLQYLHSMGLLQASFRPAAEVRALRALWRHRDAQVRLSTVHIQHMQKAMDQMNLQIQHVIADITGATGTAIIEAILAGERDPQVLAKLRDPRIKATEATLVAALTGHYRNEHVFCLKQAFEAYLFCLNQIGQLDAEILRQVEVLCPAPVQPSVEATPPKRSKARTPGPNSAHLLAAICGVDLLTIPGINIMSAQTIVAETGGDLSAFASPNKFCSWLSLCPNNKVTAGKILSSHPRPGNNRVARALRNAAQGLHHAKNELGDFYRRMRAKLGGAAAIVATAHKLARIVYAVLRSKKPYDPSLHLQDNPHARRRKFSRLQSLAKEFGFVLTPQ
jgi:transposase